MFEVWKCLNPNCGLRYSITAVERGGNRCPRCRSDSRLIIGGVAQQAVPGDDQSPAQSGLNLLIVLDNIRSAGNVGSIFRSADGAGVAGLHLCGVTPAPDNPGVKKTALGAEKTIPWVRHPDGVEAVLQLKDSGCVVWALEGGQKASPLMDVDVPTSGKLALVVGNEIGGVDPGIIDLCDKVVYLPMKGSKGSLNVAVACGIAVYWLRFLSGSARRVIDSR